jgi:predicted secreted hydrolase
MTAKITGALTFVILIFIITLGSGCSSEEEKSYPYGTPQVQFPQDEGAHPEAGVEWWYLNSILTDSEGNKYGAMVAYFNPGLKIISISDIEEQRSYPEVYFGIPDYAEGHLDLRWGEFTGQGDDDRWYRTDTDSLAYNLKANGNETGLDLDLISEKPPLMVGGDGLIDWTYGSSYYYSLTRLGIEGQIELTGRTIEVEGDGWMDHQWMDSLGGKGWDWFSVQLDNNTEIIFWQIVNPDESIESLDMTIMFPDSSIYHTTDLILERLDSWISPASGNDYGTLWRVKEDTHDLDLEIRARHPEQEVRVFEQFEDMDFDFWEGGTTVTGSLNGESVSGTGYAELVGIPTGMPEGAVNPWE